MTDVQAAFLERVDVAVAIGTVGLAVVILLLTIIAVGSLRSHG